MPEFEHQRISRTNRPRLPGQPLLRLLAINLVAGIVLAALLIGGLLVLNPARLRDLIFADRNGAAALGMLLFGFIVTFGSVVMGSAIMALSEAATPPDGNTGLPVRVSVRRSRHPNRSPTRN